MTGDVKRYANWQAVESAIKAAALRVNEENPSRQVGDLIRQAHYDRFVFTYTEHHPILTDDLQPYADGFRVTFDARLGPKPLGTIKVDLSTHDGATDEISGTLPANRLSLPNLACSPYRLYPLPKQIADKVCATLTSHNGRPSSREKDLVDLVIIALTQAVSADTTRAAILHEARLRGITVPDTFALPLSWGTAYTKLAKNSTAAGQTFADARDLMRDFVDPVLSGSVGGTYWNPKLLTWEQAP